MKNITKLIADKINRLPAGYVFSYLDIINEADKKEAVIKALNRLVNSGKLKKISKGRFYKPEETPFGELEPDEYQIAKDLLEKNDKIIGYLTGLSIYNKLGLTTQISNTIQIGRNEFRPPLVRGKYKISFILQKNAINKENIPLLQLLDSIRFLKKIPDSNIEFIINRFKALLANLTDEQLKRLIRLLIKYPANTRALTGALLDEINKNKITEKIKSTLNPITVYKIGVTKEILSSVENWNIK
jgi:hypothetical protein